MGKDLLEMAEFSGFRPGSEPVRIGLDRVGKVEVSTVRLPKLFKDEVDKYETCLFHDNGKSEVVATYLTREDAAIYHARFVSALAFVEERS